MLLSDGTGTPPVSGFSCGWTTSALISFDPRRDPEQRTGDRRGDRDGHVAPATPLRGSNQPEAGEVEAHAEQREEREDRPADRADAVAADHPPGEEREEHAVRDAARCGKRHCGAF